MSFWLKSKIQKDLSIAKALLGLWLFFIAGGGFAQNSPYRASTTFTSIPMDYNQHTEVGFFNDLPSGDTVRNKLFILGVNKACVRVQALYRGFDTVFNLDQGGLAQIFLPPKNPQHPYYLPITNTITVQASRPVTVLQGVGIGRESLYPNPSNLRTGIINHIEATALLPNSIFNASQTQHPFVSESSWLANDPLSPRQFAWCMPLVLQSLSPNNALRLITSITLGLDPITPVELYTPGDTLLLNLAKHETIYFSRVTKSFEENNKTTISSLLNLPYKVYITSAFTGHNFDGFHSQGGFVFEDLKPPSTYKRAYHVPPVSGSVANQYAFIATQDSTMVETNGVAFVRLDSLERLDTCIAGPRYFKANQAFFLSMTPCLDDSSSNNPSPYMVYPPGDSDLMQESLFATLNEPTFANDYRLAVSLPTAGVGAFSLNGQVVPSILFSAFPTDPNWSWADIPIDSGVYNATCPTGFNAFQYSWYKDPNATFTEYPNYGYNLSESIVWPIDSFKLRLGSNANALDTAPSQALQYCVGETFYLSPPKDRYTTWQWQIGDSLFYQKSRAQAAPAFAYTIARPGLYNITVTDSLGCGSFDSAAVNILEAPTANFEYTLVNTCSQTTLSLNNTSQGATSFTWRWLGDSSRSTSPTLSLPSGTTDTLLRIELLAQGQRCSSKVIKEIPLKQTPANLNLPNVLSPNGDGINDTWCFTAFEGYQGCFTVAIYNRWGAPVYQSQNPSQCWDPRNLAAGVYFYRLALAGQEFKGNITLFK